jgi:O-antigen ligase
LMAAIGIFEGLRHWLLFGGLPARWGWVVSFSLYYLRGGTVRAMASAGHPLTLGYLLGIALGFWFCLQSKLSAARYRIGFTVLLSLGLIATYSRGPWLGAAVIFFVFNFLRPRAVSALMKAGGGALILGIVISFTPLGDKIANVLPSFSASSADESVIYRHRLLDRALEIIQENPLLGDQYALLKMQDLRQGEGIIDIINTYVGVALASGAVGLALFLSLILMGLFKAWAWSRRTYAMDPELGAIGASLVACIIGTLVMMFDGSFGGAVERLFYTLAALAAAYAHLGSVRQQRMPDPVLGKGSSRTPA